MLLRKFICVACGDVRDQVWNHLYHPSLSRHGKNQTFKLEPCELSMSLSLAHYLPRGFVPVDSRIISRDCEYVVLIERIVLPILNEHEVACRAASSPLCGVCSSATTHILQTPISIIQDTDHPFPSVWVHSLCDKAKCEAQTKKDIDSIIGKLKQQLLDEMRS